MGLQVQSQDCCLVETLWFVNLITKFRTVHNVVNCSNYRLRLPSMSTVRAVKSYISCSFCDSFYNTIKEDLIFVLQGIIHIDFIYDSEYKHAVNNFDITKLPRDGPLVFGNDAGSEKPIVKTLGSW